MWVHVLLQIAALRCGGEFDGFFFFFLFSFFFCVCVCYFLNSAWNLLVDLLSLLSSFICVCLSYLLAILIDGFGLSNASSYSDCWIVSCIGTFEILISLVRCRRVDLFSFCVDLVVVVKIYSVSDN